MFSVQQEAEDRWVVRLTDDGLRAGLTAAADGAEGVFTDYGSAVGFIGDCLTASRDSGELDSLLAAAGDTDDGLLPNGWRSDTGICFNEETGDGRDFTQCAWDWRDPSVSLLPLMFQDVTEISHFGARLAGFMAELHEADGAPQSSGRFYAIEAGRSAQAVLADGMHFGVSVDAVGADVEVECVEEDEDGWCMEAVWHFLAYTIGGLTMTPFPAFAHARIVADVAAAEGDEAVTAGAVSIHVSGRPMTERAAQTLGRTVGESAAARIREMQQLATEQRIRPARTLSIPPEPDPSWLATPEPQLGEPFALGSLGDEWLVEQGQGALAMPLHIGDDGRVLGHLAYWGQCHVGYPNTCVSPPESASAYAHFHVGETICSDGSRVPTGSFVAGCDHAAARLRAAEARDHYAHNGLGWANVRVTNGVYGPWACGVLRQDVTIEQARVLRAGAMSGDWRRLGGNLELIAALAVTAPGFPLAREAITASGLRIPDAPQVRAWTVDGVQESLVASAIVRRCPDCQRRAGEDAALAGRRRGRADDELARLRAQLAGMSVTLGIIERRTRPLIADAARREHGLIVPPPS